MIFDIKCMALKRESTVCQIIHKIFLANTLT